MTLRFHLDESVNNAVAVGLRLRGFEVSISNHVGLLGASDQEQLAYASSENRVLITHDDDFLRLHAGSARHAGIAYSRPNQRTIGRWSSNLPLWAEHEHLTTSLALSSFSEDCHCRHRITEVSFRACGEWTVWFWLIAFRYQCIMKLQRPSILIVRLSAIGDCIHGLPVLCALRDALPSAHLSWVVEGRTADLLRRHPALDAVVQLRRKWLKSPLAIWRARRQLRALRPDVVIDLQGLTKSAIAGWLSGAPTRIGFAGRDGRELSTRFNNSLVEPLMSHVIDRNLELLSPLGIVPGEVRFGLPAFDKDSAAVGRFIRDRGLSAGFAILNVGAGWPSKRWPADRFAEVARYLGERYNLRSVVAWAGAEEFRCADEVMVHAGGFAHAAPPTSLTELAALCQRAKLFVGCDTGPLHLAAAVGTSCIGLFGPTSARRNGPYGDGHITLQKTLLAGGSRERRRADDAAMREISVEDVCAACDVLMERQTMRAPSRHLQPLAA